MERPNPTSQTFVSCVNPPDDQQAPAYWFVFQKDKLLVQPKSNRVDVPRVPEPAKLGIAPARQLYLGYLQEDDGQRVDCYAAEIDAGTPVSNGMITEGLRQLYSQLDEVLFHLAGRAVQIINWDRTHRYCGRCGTPSATMASERAKQCPKCGLISYPRLSPAIIIAVVRRTQQDNLLLLARNHRFPPGRYSVIAGFVEPGESLEECAQREVFEEVGIHIRNISYFGSQPWPFPNSLMVGFTAEYDGGELVLEEAEIDDAQWFTTDNLPLLPPKISIARRLIEWFVAENRAPEIGEDGE